MNLDDIVRVRRSTRQYLDAPITTEQIKDILLCASLSPSAKNRQPWFFSVLTASKKNDFGQRLLKKALETNEPMAAKTAGIIEGCAALILVFSGKDHPCPSRSDVLSVGCAMYAMCLKATDMGLGSLIIADTDIIAEDVEALEDCGVLYGAVALGHPVSHDPPRPRKPLAEITDLRISEDTKRVHDPVAAPILRDSAYAFCSYSHENTPAVISDMLELQMRNIPIWYDKQLPIGEKWDDNAASALLSEHCRGILLYISPESIASKAVAKELSVALKRKRTDPDFAIIPIHMGGAPLSDIIAVARKRYGLICEQVFTEAFGSNNAVIYVPRDVFPTAKTHLEVLIDTLERAEIVPDGRVYNSFSYHIAEGSYAVITKYLGFSPVVEVPSEISGYPVRVIGKNAFTGNGLLEECVLPDGLVCVDEGVFRDCPHLKRVRIPHTVTDMRVACFRDCVSLPSVELPPGITVLPEAFFRGCLSLTEIRIPEGVVSLEEACFMYCSSLRRAVLPNTLKRASDGCFFGCTELRELVIPQEVVGFRKDSFAFAKQLSSVTVSGLVFEAGIGRKL